MRTPFAIGVVVFGAIVLTFVALLHLAASRKRTGGKLGWTALVLALPVVGPLVYFVFGRGVAYDDDGG